MGLGKDGLLVDPGRLEAYTPGGRSRGEITVGWLPSLEQVRLLLLSQSLTSCRWWPV